MASTSTTSPYQVLGLQHSASRTEVKEAFIRLCKVYHPDKCAPDMRRSAETRFREIKGAYDDILRGQAGYKPPPPGSTANPRYAREYYRAHGMGMDFGEWGPVRCGGPFGGFATETDFYRSMLRSSRNNPFVVIVMGLMAIPVISLSISVMNGNVGFVDRFKNEGLNMFRESNWRVNGKSSVANPFSIKDVNDQGSSYIYKYDKYRHLRPEEHESEGAAKGAPSS